MIRIDRLYSIGALVVWLTFAGSTHAAIKADMSTLVVSVGTPGSTLVWNNAQRFNENVLAYNTFMWTLKSPVVRPEYTPEVSPLGIVAGDTFGLRHEFSLTPGDRVTIDSSFTIVPEPASSVVLMTTGLLLVLRRHRD